MSAQLITEKRLPLSEKFARAAPPSPATLRVSATKHPMVWDFSEELRKWGPGAGGSPALGEARAYCAHVARSHYENFTVVSLLLPRRLVSHFHSVYAYCRWSDDLADETAGGQEALDLIAWWRGELIECYAQKPLPPTPSPKRGGGVSSSPPLLGEGPREGLPAPRHPVMIALRETIRDFAIPAEPFLNLLVAFEQDQRVKRYEAFDELLGYCRNSANPVGHLVLYLFESFDAKRAALADEVCTGLQLANFWQDVARDHAIGRVYLPAEDRRRFGYADEDLEARRFTPAFAELMRFEVEQTKGYFDRGEALLPLLPREARVDVDLFIRGGRAILKAIERIGYDVWSRRPEVSKWDKTKLLAAAARKKWLSL